MTVKRKRLLVIGICAGVLLLAAAVTLGVYLAGIARYRKMVEGLTYEPVDLSRVADGRYEGDCDVGEIYARVAVTVSGGRIEAVEILEHRHGAGHGTPAEVIAQDIVTRQSLEIDFVAGATNSGKVLKKAVENALKKGLA